MKELKKMRPDIYEAMRTGLKRDDLTMGEALLICNAFLADIGGDSIAGIIQFYSNLQATDDVLTELEQKRNTVDDTDIIRPDILPVDMRTSYYNPKRSKRSGKENRPTERIAFGHQNDDSDDE